MNIREGGQPLSSEQVYKHWPVHCGYSFAGIYPVLRVRHSSARAERFHEGVDWPQHAHKGASKWCQVCKTVALCQHLSMAAREVIDPGPGLRSYLVHIEDPCDRLLLQPFARVALVCACAVSELSRCSWACLFQGLVQPEP